MDELSVLVACRAVYLVEAERSSRTKKTKEGPPENFEVDGVWAKDSDWCKDDERIAEAEAIIKKQGVNPVSEFWKADYEKKAAKYWDAFYKRNGDRFFRDRHYVDTVFANELKALKPGQTMIELGAGVGNGVIPLLQRLNPKIQVRCLDFAPEAIRLLKARPDFDQSRCQAEVCDLAKDSLGATASAHLVTCFFVLSALSPETLPIAAKAIASVLHPSQGILCIRDYGRYDQAQLRFSKGHLLSDNFYVKQDGTRCFYFDTKQLDALFFSLGFSGKGAYYVNQRHLNRATSHLRRRVFVEASYSFCPSSS